MEGLIVPIAPVENGELPEILRVVSACVADMRRNGIEQWDEMYPNRDGLAEDIRMRTLFAARLEGRIAGMVVLNEKQDPEYGDVAWRYRPGKIGVVHRLMVDPAFQGRGVAKGLMAFLEAEAGRQGMQAMRLDAFTLNPYALRLYAGLGYEKSGVIRLRKGLFRCFEKSMAHVR